MSDFHMVVCVKAVPGSTEVKMDPQDQYHRARWQAGGH